MKHPDIIRLEELFERHPSLTPRLIMDSGELPAKGQIWMISGLCENDCFKAVLLFGGAVEENGPKVVDVAPVVHDATLAGPFDYILPEAVLCHHAAVLSSLLFSLPVEKLTACLGHIEEELASDVVGHYRAAQEGLLTRGQQHAPDFFDTRDRRYLFHSDAARQIEELQEVLYRWLDTLEQEDEWQLPDAQIIDASPFFQSIHAESKMAAAGNDRPSKLEEFTAPFELDGKRVMLSIRESLKRGWWAVVIHGDIDGRCKMLLAESGQQLAVIVHGESRFERSQQIGNAIIIADTSGRPLAKIKVK